jgi:hypothetical protein
MTPDIPSTVDAWLALWRRSTSGKDSSWLRLGQDTYSVFRSKFGDGWCASIGRSFARETWPTALDAQRGLYDLVVAMDPDELAAMHAGNARPAAAPAPAPPLSRQLARRHDGPHAPAPGPVRPAPPAGPTCPVTLATFDRETTQVCFEVREHNGHRFLAWVQYRFGPDGPRCDKLISIRWREACPLAEAILAAMGEPAR